ncbi:hypothetical protein KIN20_037534 [Parelaphostrongylus tenuis]|uniref:Uncharacterized protein n=1 Tax=Parelaphostrongylus tenuis TaxID=148309 RepID=A0AAD5REU3_PARTN|nr:hypothetical protein KIN20_037534 [Parelaphostrongylus tenuis]
MQKTIQVSPREAPVATESMKNGTAPGLGNITADFAEIGGHNLHLLQHDGNEERKTFYCKVSGVSCLEVSHTNCKKMTLRFSKRHVQRKLTSRACFGRGIE